MFHSFGSQLFRLHLDTRCSWINTSCVDQLQRHPIPLQRGCKIVASGPCDLRDDRLLLSDECIE